MTLIERVTCNQLICLIVPAISSVHRYFSREGEVRLIALTLALDPKLQVNILRPSILAFLQVIYVHQLLHPGFRLFLLLLTGLDFCAIPTWIDYLESRNPNSCHSPCKQTSCKHRKQQFVSDNPHPRITNRRLGIISIDSALLDFDAQDLELELSLRTLALNALFALATEIRTYWSRCRAPP